MATASALCLGAAHADVGIGTETPTASLHVVGEGAGAGRDLRVERLDPPATDATLRVVVTDPEGYFSPPTLMISRTGLAAAAAAVPTTTGG